MRQGIILFSLCAIIQSSVADCQAFEPDDRWNTTVTNGGTGTTGSPITLTWSLADDGTNLPDGAAQVGSDLIAMLDLEFGAGPGGTNYALRPWFSIFTDSFDRLSELAGLDYVYETNDDGLTFSQSNGGVAGLRGDVRIGGRTYGAGSPTLASNFFPDYGEMMINTDKGSFFDNGPNNFRSFRNTLMHEALHGVGISHVDGDSPGFLMEPAITASFDGPQIDDLLAMQRLYGDAYEKNGGNDAFSAATPLGQVSPLQVAVLGQNGSSTVIWDTQSDFVSIDDDSDVDYFSFTLTEPQNIGIDLRPQGTSYQTGPEGGLVATLDTRLLNDLSLRLFNTNGVSLLGASNVLGVGGAESLSISLGPGTYYTQVTGTLNNIQLYELTVAVAGAPENLLWTGQVSNVWDLQATANFDAGGAMDIFTNLDTVTFDDAGQETTVSLEGSLSPAAVVVDASVDYTFVGTGALTGGSLTLNGTGTVELANSGNNYSGDTLVNGGTLILSGDTSAMISAITVASGATLVMDSAPAAGNSSTFEVQPGGILQVGRATSSADVFPNNPVSLVNNGVVRIVDYELVTGISGSGDVIAGAELALLAGNSYTGQTIVEADGSIQPTDSTAFGSVAGNTIVQPGGYIIARDDEFGPASLDVAESFILAGSGDGAGALQIAAGTTATFQGGVTIAAGGAKMRVSGLSSAVLSGAFDATAGQASFDIAAGSSLELGGSAVIGGQGLVKLSPGPLTFTAMVDLGGPTDIQAGLLSLAGGGSVTGSVRVAGGATLALAGTATWDAASALTGTGTIDGNLAMPGTIAPGDSMTGELHIDGNLTLSSSSALLIEIGGPVTGQFDQLDVTGLALLDGTLAVELIDLGGGIFQPQLGDSFGFLDAQNGTAGIFDSWMLPSLAAGLAWQLSPIGTATFLNVVSSTSADFDNDGDVDADDLAQWEADFGAAGSDANGDGIATGADFLIWQQQIAGGPALALSATVSTRVPEPTSLYLMAAALTGVITSWRSTVRSRILQTALAGRLSACGLRDLVAYHGNLLITESLFVEPVGAGDFLEGVNGCLDALRPRNGDQFDIAMHIAYRENAASAGLEIGIDGDTAVFI